MAPNTRKRKPAATNSSSVAVELMSSPQPTGLSKTKYKDDDPFERTFNAVDDASDDESDHSEYGRRGSAKRKRRSKESRSSKKQKQKRWRADPGRRYGPTPAVPDLSDDECTGQSDGEDQASDDGLWSVKRRKSSVEAEKDNELPTVLSIQVNGTCKEKTIINLNLSDLLKNSQSHSPTSSLVSFHTAGDSDLLEDTTLVHGQGTITGRAGFLDLPYELRVRVYRQVFRGQEPLNFGKRVDFSRSSAFLRTCKLVHDEGAEILYSENSFHFVRTNESRGRFWEQHWKPIGYKDIRRFLEAIGPANISHLKHVSFALTDGTDNSQPVRFVNDSTLHHVFRLIGANATLDKLAVTFAGRAQVMGSDYHFLKAFTEIKCHTLLIYTQSWMRYDKIALYLKPKLRSVMEIPWENEHELEPAKRSNTKVKMVYDGDRGIHFI